MRTVLNAMKKRKNEWIPREKLDIFENIIETHFIPGRGSTEGDNEFMKAVGKHFTQAQRFRIWEGNGGCKGTGHEKARKVFASEYTDKPLFERLTKYIDTFEKKHGKTLDVVLDEESKFVTYTFACDECSKHIQKGKLTAPHELYYERCALGRMDNLQTALGLTLKVKQVYIPASGVNKETPCVFTYEIVG